MVKRFFCEKCADEGHQHYALGCPLEDDCSAQHLCDMHYFEDAERRGVLEKGQI